LPTKKHTGLGSILKDTFSNFGDDKVTKLSGSLAYSTIFALGPFLVVIIALCSLFLDREAVQGHIYTQLKGLVGSDTAAQLQSIIKNAAINGKGVMAAIIGGITLLIGATSIFSEIQDSINDIWGIKAKPKRGWLQFLRNRFLSFSLIASLGFLLLVSLSVSAVIEGFNNRLRAHFPEATVVIFYILNLVITFIVTTFIFGVIFKVLPDAKIKWRDIIWGAIATAFLFMLGKFAISFYISKSNVGSTFGAAGSLVILLLWVYYSSVILYLGAELTKAYATAKGTPIFPSDYAVTVKRVEVQTGKKPVHHETNMVKKQA
jgi:membrane protein